MATRALANQPAPLDLPDVARWLPAALVLAATAELLLLRLFTRTAIHIPGIQHVAGPYTVLAESGRLAYYVATILLALLLLLLGSRAIQNRSLAGGTAALGIGAFLAGAGGAASGAFGETPLAVLSLATVVALLLPVYARLGFRRAVPVALFGAAFALAGAFMVMQRIGGGAPSDLLWAGEALALAAAAGAPLLVTAPAVADRRDRRRVMLVAAALAIVVFVALLANTATVKILTLWSFGLAGYFPAAVYAAAAGGVTYAVVSAVYARHWAIAIGLSLLALGGIGLHNTYQTGLVVAGLGLLAGQQSMIGALRANGGGSAVEEGDVAGALHDGAASAVA